MENIQNRVVQDMTYNNCFTLGCKSKKEDGSYKKIPAYIDQNGTPMKLYGGKGDKLRRFYELPYEQAKEMVDAYMKKEERSELEKSLHVSLYLDNAKFGNLHIFVIDFDKLDGTVETDTTFFRSAKELADKVTCSQGGGYHMFYGVDKEKGTPLFDSINLLTAKGTKSYISKTGAVTLDGKNKVDMFCDALHFIYEWEEWDNTAGLTDKTQELYELIKANFELKRPMDIDKRKDSDNGFATTAKRKDADDGFTTLKDMTEAEVKQQMNDKQKAVFEDLKAISPDCSREIWFSIGLDIYHAFGDELGGSVFWLWSKPGHSFNPQGCTRTWSNICNRGPKTELRNSKWDSLLAESAC